MNLEQFYNRRDENYQVILGRFMGNEKLLGKFVRNFPDDPTYGLLCDAMKAGNWEQAEMSAHTLKGVAANLSFPKLFESSANLVNTIRCKDLDKADGLFQEVKRTYEEVLQDISGLD